jgi:hypothetical protein
MKKKNYTFCISILLLLIQNSYAQNTDLTSRVLVIRNVNSQVSIAIANDYMSRRGVANVVDIKCPDDADDQNAESINYPDYLTEIEAPISAYLKAHTNIDFIVFTKGTPIRIITPPINLTAADAL